VRWLDWLKKKRLKALGASLNEESVRIKYILVKIYFGFLGSGEAWLMGVCSATLRFFGHPCRMPSE